MAYTPELQIRVPDAEASVPAFQSNCAGFARILWHSTHVLACTVLASVMKVDGTFRDGVAEPDIDRETAIKYYHHMARLQVLDTIFYDAQRQVCVCVCARNLSCCGEVTPRGVLIVRAASRST